MTKNAVELRGGPHTDGHQHIGRGHSQQSVLVGVNVLLMVHLPVFEVAAIVELAGVERPFAGVGVPPNEPDLAVAGLGHTRHAGQRHPHATRGPLPAAGYAHGLHPQRGGVGGGTHHGVVVHHRLVALSFVGEAKEVVGPAAFGGPLREGGPENRHGQQGQCAGRIGSGRTALAYGPDEHQRRQPGQYHGRRPQLGPASAEVEVGHDTGNQRGRIPHERKGRPVYHQVVECSKDIRLAM